MSSPPKRYIVLDKGSYRWSRHAASLGKMEMEFVPDKEVHYVHPTGLTPDIQEAQVFTDGDLPKQVAAKKKFLDRPEEYTILPVILFTEDLLVTTIMLAMQSILPEVLVDASQ